MILCDGKCVDKRRGLWSSRRDRKKVRCGNIEVCGLCRLQLDRISDDARYRLLTMS